MAFPLNMGANLYAKRVPLQLIGGLAHQTIFIPSQGGPPNIFRE